MSHSDFRSGVPQHEDRKRAFLSGRTCLPRESEILNSPKAFSSWLRPLFRHDWVVYYKRPFGGPEHALRYRGSHTHRVAISNHRLVAFANQKVTFRWRDSANPNKKP